jgi:hypothetical protein
LEFDIKETLLLCFLFEQFVSNLPESVVYLDYGDLLPDQSFNKLAE